MGQQAAIGQKFADERARRQRSSERVRSFNRAMEGTNGVLPAANEVATENASRSSAEQAPAPSPDAERAGGSMTFIRKAAALVDAYKAGFLAQCSQAGPVRSGNFTYVWNARGSESRLADEFARQQRNQMFQVQVSP